MTSFGFFVGLLEGDGSIQVNQWRKRNLQYRVVIKLKYTLSNHKMLSEIRDDLELFNVHIRHGYVLLVEDDQRKLKKLISLIDDYGGFVLTKVRKRYAFFKYALTRKIRYSEYESIKNNESWFGYLEILPFSCDEIMKLPLYNDWLCGFVEAESCFSVRENGNHSFSIAQKEEEVVIESIKKKFALPNKIQKKANGLFVIETYNRRSLADVITFFDDKLKGEKQLQVNRFKTYFYKS